MANTRLFSISICAGLLIALCGEVPAYAGKDYQPILVEACGFGIPEVGKPERRLREEAIEDALKNAEMQALVSVDMQIHIEDLRIKERRFHLSSFLGSAKLVRILQANYVTNSPLYHVRVEAKVLQSLDSPMNSEVAVELNQPPSKVILNIQSKPDPSFGNSLRHILAEQLLDRGFELASSSIDPETVVLNISLTQLSEISMMKLQWNMERQSALEGDGSYSIDRIIGDRLVPLSEQFPKELSKLGALLVLETTRLTSP